METAPVTLAHDHARQASIATHNADTTVAISEHALAAGEFSKAAAVSNSHEAVRTLRLLEQHHQRLSDLLKFPTEHPVPTSAAEKKLTTSAAVAELRASKHDAASPGSPLRSSVSSAQRIPKRLPPRDLTSSIASNLATARGIRTGQGRRALSPSVSMHQAPGSLEVHHRRGDKGTRPEPSIPEHGKPSWVPPMHGSQVKSDPQSSTSRASAKAQPAASNPGDEGFNRFYSTFESLLSKISAPLAFTGLPLVSEESTKDVPEKEATSPASPNPRRSKAASPSTLSDSQAPDLSKYISRAALRASAHPAHGNDSFYVVPSTGHTVSYAGILSFAEKEKRRLAASMHSNNPDVFVDPNDPDQPGTNDSFEEEFVDARETPAPLSRGNSSSLSRMVGKRIGGRGKDAGLENAVEELYLENKSLKGMVDIMSKRLQAFEAAAQSSSLALHESMRFMQPGETPARGAAAGGGRGKEEELLGRLRELEEQLQAGDREKAKMAREIDKLNKVLEKYRDRWEKLKDGAKARREGAKMESGAATKESSAKEADGNSQAAAVKGANGRFLAG